MKRSDLAHILRAAAEIASDGRILIIGSQAVLASFTEEALPERATMSMEADLAFFDDDSAAKSDRVDGAIGEGSRFHRLFGYYAQGVETSTAVLPAGWEQRVVEFRFGDHGDAEAVCPEIHDLVASKLAAERQKDLEYASALADAGLIDLHILRERVDLLPLLPAAKRRVQAIIGRFEEQT